MSTTSASVEQAINAWRLCPSAAGYSKAIDMILLASWRGVAIAWPQFEGESFDIVRVDNSAVIDDDMLPIDEALAVPWHVHKLSPPVLIATPVGACQ